jgi:5-formyltetrahydrofolate cyclo-ligase
MLNVEISPGLPPAETKAALRIKMREALGKVSLAVRTVESLELCNRLEPQLRSARRILFYAPMPDELDVWPLLEKLLPSGKTCALPAYDPERQAYMARRILNLETDIFEGKFGISEPLPGCEPAPLESFDLVLVPGMAFDLHGNRLGRGKGFYDRILAGASGVKCGIAYDFQITTELPAEPHDARVSFIVTPSRSLRGSA